MELALDLCDEIVILNKGILKEMPRKSKKLDEWKKQIIEELKGENEDE